MSQLTTNPARSGRRRGGARAVLGVGLLCLLGSSACTAEGASTSSGSGGGGSVNDQAAYPDVQGSAEGGASALGADGKPQAAKVLQSQVIRTGELSVTVTDATSAADKVLTIVSTAGGTVGSDRRSGTASSAKAELVLRIPPAKLQSVLDTIGKLGKETARTITADDVATVVADIKARITALQTSVTRLLTLAKTAANTGDLLKIESELTARQGELDSLTAQQTALADQVSMATLTVHLVVKPAQKTIKKAGFSGNLSTGWDDLVSFGATVLALIGRLLPWLAVVALLAVPAVVVWRRRQLAAKRAQQPAQPETPTDEDVDAPAAV